MPEFSFVLGTPPDPEANVRETIEFIRRIKRINPATEIVMYVYTPVPLDGLLYEQAKRAGFTFPQTLDEWTSEHWYQLSLRRGDRIPWVNSAVRRQVQNFERVLNAYYPTVTDQRLGRGVRYYEARAPGATPPNSTACRTSWEPCNGSFATNGLKQRGFSGRMTYHR